MERVTRSKVIEKAIDSIVWSDEELVVLHKIQDSFNRKNSSKVNKTTIANVGVKNDILALLADGRARTSKEIAEELGYTTNKVASLLRAIVLDGKAEKVKGDKSKDAPKYVGNEDAEPYAEPVTEEEDA